MKIIGTKKEVETVLSALPGADMFGSNPIPTDGWRAEYQWVPIEIVLDEMNAAGTIHADVEPARPGKWIEDDDGDGRHCSECGQDYCYLVSDAENYHYCPNCGAKMSAVNNMEKRTITVCPSCFAPEFDMIIPVPDGRDAEEYIDELLDGLLNNDLRYNVEWDFTDCIS